jgi:hypothetical protein
MKTLDAYALKYNTDKSSNEHDYAKLYDYHFSPLRNDKLKLLELGIYAGSSLKMWADYFKVSEIHGVDNDISIANINNSRIIIKQLNVDETQELKEWAVSHGPYKIIIDDCSHINNQMINSFNELFPLLESGGWYVIEDLHACYWYNSTCSVLKLQTKPSFIDTIIKHLTDNCIGNGKFGNASAWSTLDKRSKEDEEQHGHPNWYDENVKAIHIYKSICFIEKN